MKKQLCVCREAWLHLERAGQVSEHVGSPGHGPGPPRPAARLAPVQADGEGAQERARQVRCQPRGREEPGDGAAQAGGHRGHGPAAGQVQYSTVQYSTVQYSTVQYSTVQCSAVQYSTVQYGASGCDTYLYSPPILASSLKGAWERYGTFFSFFSSAM